MEKKHIPPTAKQKLRIYKMVKKILSLDTAGRRCICDCIYDAQYTLKYMNGVMRRWKTGNDYGDGNCMKNNFPELYKQKPFLKPVYRYWWSITSVEGFNKRLAVLDLIIFELNQEIEAIDSCNPKL